jgi:hypothetical protein
MSSSRPKRHHYVPEWYLEQFTDTKTGKVTICDLKKKKWREQIPNEIMCIKHHNRQEWVPKGVDPNIFENAIGEKIENPAKTSFKKLIENPRTLSSDDMALMITYLHLQRIRVPRQADLAKEALKEFLYNVSREDPDIAAFYDTGLIRANIKEKLLRFQYMLAATGQYSPYFSRMIWEVNVAPDDAAFITTDSPVSFFNESLSPDEEPNISLAGTMVLFPLTPKHLLVLKHPDIETAPAICHIPLDKIEKRPHSFARIQISSEIVAFYNMIMTDLAHELVAATNRAVIVSGIRK